IDGDAHALTITIKGKKAAQAHVPCTVSLLRQGPLTLWLRVQGARGKDLLVVERVLGHPLLVVVLHPGVDVRLARRDAILERVSPALLCVQKPLTEVADREAGPVVQDV